jgi:hypothetical protein
MITVGHETVGRAETVIRLDDLGWKFPKLSFVLFIVVDRPLCLLPGCDVINCSGNGILRAPAMSPAPDFQVAVSRGRKNVPKAELGGTYVKIQATTPAEWNSTA